MNSVGFVAEESHSSLRHSALHLWASIMDRSVTQACRAALSGDENVRKCYLSVPYFTLGRRKCTKVLPKRAVLYSRATKSVGFVAQEPPSSLRHSALHLSATKMGVGVAQACRTAPSGDEKARQCCPSVSCRTLGRRKWAEVSPESVVPHSRATKMLGSVIQACRAAPSGDEKCGFRCPRAPFILTSFCPTPTGNKNGRKCRLNVSCRTLGRRRSAEVSLKRVVLHSWETILG